MCLKMFILAQITVNAKTTKSSSISSMFLAHNPRRLGILKIMGTQHSVMFYAFVLMYDIEMKFDMNGNLLLTGKKKIKQNNNNK